MSQRLPAVRPRQLIRVLEKRGWKLVRSKGSHHHFRHPDNSNLVVVPVHPRDIKRGTLSAILSDAGISREEFRKLV